MAKDNTSLGGAFPPSANRGGAAQKGASANAPQPPPQAQSDSVIGRVAGRGKGALKRLEDSKLAMKQTGAALLHTTETMGSLFMGSMAEGYLGQEKLKLGGMDVRAPVGLATQAYGIYSIMTGEKGGEHALAIGNGVTGSWLASVGREAGQAFRDRKGGPARGQAPAGAPAAPASGASFRGESPMVYIPPEPEVIAGLPAPSYQEYPQLPAPYQGQTLLPAPWQGPQYQQYPQYQPQQYQTQQYPGYQGAPSMQGNMVPVEPVQMGAYPPGYPQPSPQMMAYAQGPVPGWNQPGGPGHGAATPGPMPGLMPEPGPRVAGAHREIMLTPESASMEGPYRQPAPRMMLTPEAPPEGQFEGRRIMLTPEAKAQVQATAQTVHQRREAMAQAYQAQQAQQAQQSAQNAPVDPTTQVAGDPEDFAGPRERQERRQQRRDALRQLGQNRFPSARALNEELGE